MKTRIQTPLKIQKKIEFSSNTLRAKTVRNKCMITKERLVPSLCSFFPSPIFKQKNKAFCNFYTKRIAKTVKNINSSYKKLSRTSTPIAQHPKIKPNASVGKLKCILFKSIDPTSTNRVSISTQTTKDYFDNPPKLANRALSVKNLNRNNYSMKSYIMNQNKRRMVLLQKGDYCRNICIMNH